MFLFWKMYQNKTKRKAKMAVICVSLFDKVLVRLRQTYVSIVGTAEE